MTSCEKIYFHGKEDPISPIEDIQAIAENLPEARFHTVENAGHLVLSQHFGSLLAQMLEADSSQRIAI